MSLLDQWRDEIEEKCRDNQFSVLIYHGKGKDSITKKKYLLRYDVVITTYQTLVSEFPDEETAEKKARAAAKKAGHPQNWAEYVESCRRGLLYQVEWFRVVLDEAREFLLHVSEII